MLKLRKQNKISDFYSKTQPDEIPNSSSHRLDSLDPQQSLFQISLKANQQQYAGTIDVWSKQIVKTQTINLLTPCIFQEGCLNKTLTNLKASTVRLNKKQFQLKKWKEKKYRQSELKKSIVQNQKKKLCVPINFNLKNYEHKKHTTRIHSRAYSTSIYSSNETAYDYLRSRSQICCDLQSPLSRQNKKEKEELLFCQKDSKRAQNQLLVHKKKAKTLRQTSDTDQQGSFRQPSFSNYFNILNNLIQQQKKKVLFPLKRLSPTAKLKGIFQRRRHSVNK